MNNRTSSTAPRGTTAARAECRDRALLGFRRRREGRAKLWSTTEPARGARQASDMAPPSAAMQCYRRPSHPIRPQERTCLLRVDRLIGMSSHHRNKLERENARWRAFSARVSGVLASHKIDGGAFPPWPAQCRRTASAHPTKSPFPHARARRYERRCSLEPSSG